jgi:hypothetical protein
MALTGSAHAWTYVTSIEVFSFIAIKTSSSYGSTGILLPYISGKPL